MKMYVTALKTYFRLMNNLKVRDDYYNSQRRTLGDDLAPLVAAARPQLDQPVASGQHHRMRF